MAEWSDAQLVEAALYAALQTVARERTLPRRGSTRPDDEEDGDQEGRWLPRGASCGKGLDSRDVPAAPGRPDANGATP